jgi:hypothetical protein
MVWTAPKTWTIGEVLTAANMNAQLRDNLLETMVAKVTTAGDIVYATAANALARLGIGATGAIMYVTGGAPAWLAAGAQGALLRMGASTPNWLAKGTALQLLRVNSGATDIEWASLSSVLTPVSPGSEIIYPITTPSTSISVLAWSPLGNALAVQGTNASSNAFAVYPYDPSTHTLGQPVLQTGLAGTIVGMSWSPDGAYIACAVQSTPFIQVYPWSGTAIGTVVTSPVSLPAGQGSSVAFSPDGSWLAVGHATTPFVSVYAWSAGFGAKTTPGTPPPAESHSIVWSPTGASLVVGSASTPYIKGYPMSGGTFGTPFSAPATVPGNYASTLAMNAAGTYLAVGTNASPYLFIYPYSDTAFGTKLADYGVLPGGQAVSVRWWESGSVSLLLQTNISAKPGHVMYTFSGGAITKMRPWDFQKRTVLIAAGFDDLYPPTAQAQPCLEVNPVNKAVALLLTGNALRIIPPVLA